MIFFGIIVTILLHNFQWNMFIKDKIVNVIEENAIFFISIRSIYWNVDFIDWTQCFSVNFEAHYVYKMAFLGELLDLNLLDVAKSCTNIF